ncbi:hypothetical protein [Thioclava sp. F28-4]|uniref:hypothetical protein n=1 Tax=Thioclava sp. F28-4 TaxID=1915315 RepID=UPI000995E84C|nr:hypothetical protein [Thioclava sp. F28-4]OOY02666.1 hypothetical protein BMI87_21745 [Thioclava sp. F28-4]
MHNFFRFCHYVVAVAFSAAPTIATSQSLDGMLLGGVVNGAKQKGAEMLNDAPQQLDNLLSSARTGKEFASETECLGNLQVLANGAAVMAKLMPFSSAATLEDQRGPVARVRLLVNGEKIHTEVWCDGQTMKAKEMPWGPGSKEPADLARGSFDAALGTLLLLQLQGAFKGHTTADRKTETGAEAPPLTTSSPTPDLSGPPMTDGEKADLAASLQECVSLGAAPKGEASVAVRLKMNPDGTPVISSTAFVDGSGAEGNQSALFEMVRRAIVLCGADGLNLPSAKFGAWKVLDLEFDGKQISVN